jgi:LysR family nitrogen assimilation transcriptional regulator
VPLVVEQLLLVGNAQARLVLDSPVPISQLDNIPMILPGRPNVVRAQIEHALHRAGGNYNSRFEADTPSLCLELTRRGLGFTIMPYCAVHGRIEGAEFTAAPVKNLNVIWAMHISRAREHLASVRTLTSDLRAFIAAQISEGQWPFTQIMADRSLRARYRAKIPTQRSGRRSGSRYSASE